MTQKPAGTGDAVLRSDHRCRAPDADPQRAASRLALCVAGAVLIRAAASGPALRTARHPLRGFVEHVGRGNRRDRDAGEEPRSEEHTSELQSLMRISYAVFCLKKKQKNQ